MVERLGCVVAVPNLIVFIPVPSNALAPKEVIVVGKSGAQVPAATLKNALSPILLKPVPQTTFAKDVSWPNSWAIPIFPLPKVKVRPELFVVSLFLPLFRNAA